MEWDGKRRVELQWVGKRRGETEEDEIRQTERKTGSEEERWMEKERDGDREKQPHRPDAKDTQNYLNLEKND